jgi:hypothetical protein
MVKVKVLFTILFIVFLQYTVYANEHKIEIIENGTVIEKDELNFNNDIKTVKYIDDYKIYTDYPWGYSIKIPDTMNINLEYNGAFIRFFSNDIDLKVSKEYSPYKNIDWYFEMFLNKYILNEDYRRENNIEIIDNKTEVFAGYETKVLSFRRVTENKNLLNEYVFAYVKISGQVYYNFFFKTDRLEEKEELIYGILDSLKVFSPKGDIKYNLELEPNTEIFNEETKEVYNKIRNSEKVIWGFFTPNIMGDESKLDSIENALEYKFPVILQYQYLNAPFPLEVMNKAYEAGKIVELTLQTTTSINDGKYKANVVFDIIDGKYDDLIREFANGAKNFKHPFLFRLNNEMNSDWCDYSGIALLSDSDLYKLIWKRIYNIFVEEGVDNAIWVFNPNDCNFPPANWNLHFAYFPGKDYVHMIGLTGYNTGNYYENVTNEKWRSFKEIYDNLAHDYRKLYSKYPWIITEFASSSVGGDKEQWIKDMFIQICKYPEIKIAVWWSYADFDYSEGSEGIPARRYWLEEKIEYLEAFKEGLGILRNINTQRFEKINANFSTYRVIFEGNKAEEYMYCKNTKNSTYVPLRRVVKYFGGSVLWNTDFDKIIVSKGKKRIFLNLNNRFAYVNGVCKGIGEELILENDTTMIPLEFIANELDGDFKADYKSNIIQIFLSNQQ